LKHSAPPCGCRGPHSCDPPVRLNGEVWAALFGVFHRLSFIAYLHCLSLSHAPSLDPRGQVSRYGLRHQQTSLKRLDVVARLLAGLDFGLSLSWCPQLVDLFDGASILSAQVFNL